MRTALFAPVTALAFACAGLSCRSASNAVARNQLAQQSRTEYPKTRVEDFSYSMHGEPIRDPFRWLERGSSPEVAEWTKSEDVWATNFLRGLPELPKFAARIQELLGFDNVTATPSKRGGAIFYFKRPSEAKKELLYVAPSVGHEERVLVDADALKVGDSVSISAFWASPKGGRVAYAISDSSGVNGSLRVRDVATGKDLDDIIDGFRYGEVAWTPDEGSFYYTAFPHAPTANAANLTDGEIRLHRLGRNDDTQIYAERGDRLLNPQVSDNGRWLVVNSTRGDGASKPFLRNIETTGSQFISLSPGEDAACDVAMVGDELFLRTNDGAPHGHIFRVDPRRPGRDQWREVVAERTDATLEEFGVFGGRLALRYTKDVATLIEVRDLDGKGAKKVALPGIGSVFAMSGTPGDDEVFLRFRSYTSPPEVDRFSASTGKLTVDFRPRFAADTSSLEAEQRFFSSRDGTRVPMFIVHKKGLVRRSSAPTIITAYGGFGVSTTPQFYPSVVAWLERGGVFADVATRGGNEFGEEWHRAGMLTQKQHVIDDFIAGAEELIHLGWTDAQHLVARGESNGGLLVAAAITQRPDLFAVAVPRVPLTDMIRFAQGTDGGKMWVSEYGSVDDPTQFHALLAYSPYHHVVRGTRYPATLVLAANGDDLVDPMHARKFAAALQRASTGGPVLFKLEEETGHYGSGNVSRAVEREAEVFAFALAGVQ